MKLFGTSIINLRNGDVLDVEIADSEEAARQQVEDQNKMLQSWNSLRIEYRMAEIYITDK